MNLGGHDGIMSQEQIGLVRRTDPYVARVNLTLPSLQPMVSIDVTKRITTKRDIDLGHCCTTYYTS
jgi:hypothetical protein